MHQRYMRHSRVAERAVACANDFEENENHETDFHKRKAGEYREKAKKARKGGLFGGPNEAQAKAHEQRAEQHEAKERDPKYHQQEAEHHRELERAAIAQKGYGGGALLRDMVLPGWGVMNTYNRSTQPEKHKTNAEYHEGQARKYERDSAGKFA